MRQLACVAGLVVMSIMGGHWLTRALAPYPMEMPVFLYYAIDFVLRLTGNSDLNNPEDMETLGVTCLLVANCLFSALVLVCCWFGLRRHFVRFLRR
jgi:hypothetical protein